MTTRDRQKLLTLCKVLHTQVAVYLDKQDEADDIRLLAEETQHRIAYGLDRVRQGLPVGDCEP